VGDEEIGKIDPGENDSAKKKLGFPGELGGSEGPKTKCGIFFTFFFAFRVSG
jgi:hypothetical protein